MCGRYWLKDNVEELAERYGVRTVNNKYNGGIGGSEIFPSQTVPVVVNDGENKIRFLKWGFPRPVKKGLIINARSETIQEKYMFKSQFLRQRCIIPANGFFEWKREGTRKIKYMLRLANSSIFSMAGIYGDFTDIEGESYTGFVIITTTPNRVTEKIHNRMPAILPGDKEKIWVDEELKDPRVLKDLLKPYENIETPLIMEED